MLPLEIVVLRAMLFALLWTPTLAAAPPDAAPPSEAEAAREVAASEPSAEDVSEDAPAAAEERGPLIFDAEGPIVGAPHAPALTVIIERPEIDLSMSEDTLDARIKTLTEAIAAE